MKVVALVTNIAVVGAATNGLRCTVKWVATDGNNSGTLTIDTTRYVTDRELFQDIRKQVQDGIDGIIIPNVAITDIMLMTAGY